MSRLLLVLSGLLALTALPAAAADPAPSPVKAVTWPRGMKPLAYTAVTLDPDHFRTAALVTVAAKPSKSGQDVQRQAGAESAAYAGVSNKTYVISPPPAKATTGPPDSNSRFAFKQSGDAGQAWATTTAAGMPYVDTQAVGQASASGAASWEAWITTTAGHENLYVRFTVPAAELTGFTEQNGPSPWQSRIRAELMINGHPVWMTDNSRTSKLAVGGQGGGGDNCSNGFEGSNTVLPFGESLGFSDAKTASKAKVVNLWLGAFPAGQTVAVSLIVRADAVVARPCCPHDAQGKPEFFCTRATANFSWDGATTPVQFWIGPPKT
jgi:hypothetical protein